MNKNRIFLLVVGLSALFTSFWGWRNYFQGHDVFCMISWPFVPLGIFVWGDGMILGTFLFAGSVWLWFRDNSAWTGLFFSTYVALRSLIEVHYNLNAQFSPITRPWEAFMPDLAIKVHLPLVDLFVLAQITYTAVCIIAILVLIHYVKRYLKA